MSKTIHDLRIFNFAIIDIIGTFFIGYVIYHYKLLQKLGIVSFPVIMILLFILAIIIHAVLKIPTTLNHLLGISGPSLRSTNNNFLSVYRQVK